MSWCSGKYLLQPGKLIWFCGASKCAEGSKWAMHTNILFSFICSQTRDTRAQGCRSIECECKYAKCLTLLYSPNATNIYDFHRWKVFIEPKVTTWRDQYLLWSLVCCLLSFVNERTQTFDAIFNLKLCISTSNWWFRMN